MIINNLMMHFPVISNFRQIIQDALTVRAGLLSYVADAKKYTAMTLKKELEHDAPGVM